jgi:hypothetical protein
VTAVFISYAREDQTFVRRLASALEARGRDVWVDWEMEPADRWRESIREAIDAADAVVFVVSPDAVASEECGKELEHAASEHKRLIPVVCRDVEGLGVAEVLQELNWVFLREGDDFDAGVVAIERGLELNLEYIRVQTRVLTRARAWELAGRRPSPLLRGEDLRSAERWLERAAAGGEPQPTELQAQFVGESRRFAARRHRPAVVASLSVAVVAVALAAFAFIQRAQARHEARVAQSRQLGAQAESELASDPEDSIALAVKGVTLQSTPGAIHALFRALDGSRLRIDLRQPGPVDAVAFSPDSTMLATGSASGQYACGGSPIAVCCGRKAAVRLPPSRSRSLGAATCSWSCTARTGPTQPATARAARSRC